MFKVFSHGIAPNISLLRLKLIQILKTQVTAYNVVSSIANSCIMAHILSTKSRIWAFRLQSLKVKKRFCSLTGPL